MILLLVTLLSAAPASRVDYERKCLYCHSEEVTEARKLTEAQWRRTIERMRRKAPLLISRSDVSALTLFMTQTLKRGLAPPKATPFPPKAAPAKPEPPRPEPEPPPSVSELHAPLVGSLPEPEPPPVEVDPEAAVREEEALALVQRRCSKCHTLGRVFARLDTLERSLNTLERMRLKTGSGITDHDYQLLSDYLRSQF